MSVTNNELFFKFVNSYKLQKSNTLFVSVKTKYASQHTVRCNTLSTCSLFVITPEFMPCAK